MPNIIQSVLMDFFCKPITESQGYNPVNTFAYAAILIVVAFFVVFPFFEKRGIKFNSRFLLAVLPFIVLGSSLRVLEDLKLFPRSCNPFEPAFYTISPGIYIAIGLLTITALVFSILLGKKTKKETLKIFGAIGTILAVPVLIAIILHFKVIAGFALILALAAATTIAVLFVLKKAKKTLLQDRLNLLAFFAQMLDANATFVALQVYSCSEQHFLPAFLIENIGAWSFVAVKIIITLLILHYVDKEIKNKNLAGFVKIVIAILGFATGTRDLLTVAVGTCL